MSFNVTTLAEGYDNPAIQYPEHHEIFYVLAGVVEIEFDGHKQRIQAGMAVLVPHGGRYADRVLEVPHEMIAVFSPARS